MRNDKETKKFMVQQVKRLGNSGIIIVDIVGINTYMGTIIEYLYKIRCNGMSGAAARTGNCNKKRI